MPRERSLHACRRPLSCQGICIRRLGRIGKNLLKAKDRRTPKHKAAGGEPNAKFRIGADLHQALGLRNCQNLDILYHSLLAG